MMIKSDRKREYTADEELDEDKVEQNVKGDQKLSDFYINLQYATGKLDKRGKEEFIDGPTIGIYKNKKLTEGSPALYYIRIKKHHKKYIRTIIAFFEKAIERNVDIEISIMPSLKKRKGWKEF